MKILLLTEDFPPMVGGIATFLSGLSNGLAKTGSDIRVLANETPGSAQYDIQQIYPVIRYRISKILSSLHIGWLLLKLIINKRPDILFVGHEIATRGLSLLLFRRFFRIPYVVLIHEGNLHKASIVRINKIATYALLRNADLLFANSRYTRQLLIERGFQEEKIMVLTPGVDTVFFSPLADEAAAGQIRAEYGVNGMPMILNVGRLVPKKNQLRLVNAVARLRDNGLHVKCVIAGSGQEQDNLKARIEELGVGAQVLLLGDVSREDVRDLCRAADVVALPSIIHDNEYESFGIVALEASACAKPVIVGSKGGQGDAVIQDETGLVVDADDENSIAEAISRLILNKDIARRIGVSGRRHVAEKFSWDKIAGRMNGLLSNITK